MASRLLTRSKTLALTLARTSPSPLDPSQSVRCCLHSLSTVAAARSQPSVSTPTIPSSSPPVSCFLDAPKNLRYERILPRWFCVKAQGGSISQDDLSAEKKESLKLADSIGSNGVPEPDNHLKKEVICFSPLETNSTKARNSGLANESSKIKRMELSQKITFALIPVLILMSKSSLTTSVLIFSVYWQIYGFFKEIFLDYVHQEVTREWVLVYFKVLLLILAKDTILLFGLV